MNEILPYIKNRTILRGAIITIWLLFNVLLFLLQARMFMAINIPVVFVINSIFDFLQYSSGLLAVLIVLFYWFATGLLLDYVVYALFLNIRRYCNMTNKRTPSCR